MGLRSIIRRTIKKYNAPSEKQIIEEWEKQGKPVPPPHIIKQKAIAFYKNKYQLDTLVETGTYLGDMVNAQRKNFKKIISIELDAKLYNDAVAKFKKYENINLYQGDSGEVLEQIVPQIKSPTLFWLDGHYSAGITAKGELNTPIMKELTCIFRTKIDHIILIDDAREFKGEEDYPTIDQLRDFVKGIAPEYVMEVKDDIIRLTK